MPVVEDDPFGQVKEEKGQNTPSPRVVGEFHHQADTDSSVFAGHHTLGIRHNQASFGDHKHNGRDSFLIQQDPTSILVGTGIGQFQFARKPSDTVRNNTATRTADPDLTLPVVANGVYWWEFIIAIASLDTADFQHSISQPAGSVRQLFAPDGFGDPAVASAAWMNKHNSNQGLAGAGSSTARNSTTTSTVLRPSGITEVGGTAGSITLFWAQLAAIASNTTVFAGSSMRMQRIG